jgi:hypothetical protein
VLSNTDLPYPPRTLRQEAGYTRQRAAGGIIILRVTDPRIETINAWYKDCLHLMASWTATCSLRYLHDIRGAGLPTPYATDCVARVLHYMRHIPVSDGRGAILVNDSTLARLLESVINRRSRADWQVRCLSNETEAMLWLRA